MDVDILIAEAEVRQELTDLWPHALEVDSLCRWVRLLASRQSGDGRDYEPQTESQARHTVKVRHVWRIIPGA